MIADELLIHFAAICRIVVTVAKARVAGRDCTTASVAAWESVWKIAHRPTRAAVKQAHVGVDFAAICRVEIAVSESSVACVEPTHPR